jgi:1-acyl-sn-glycerol-3-phosphate acyltransferase
MILVRSIVFNLLFYSYLALLVIFGLPCLFLGRHAVQGLGRTWGRGALWLLDKVCGIKVEFRGLDQPISGPFLIAAKHQSTLETFALTLAVTDFGVILKRELTWIPLFGWYLKRAGMIAVDRRRRSTALTQAAEGARRCLADGRQVVIFPEGTRRPVGAPPLYKSGVALIYSVGGTACIPVATNTGLFWPRRSFLRPPGTVVIEFLPPIPPGLDRKTFLALLQGRIETASDALVAEAREAMAQDSHLTRLAPPLRASL